MQPQDNDFPIDQVQGGGSAAVPASDQTTGSTPVSGGETFQPKPSGGETFQPQSIAQPGPPQPDWHNDAQADANQLYSQPDNSPVYTAPSSAPPTSENIPATPSPSDTMKADFQQASNLANENPLTVSEQTDSVQLVPPSPTTEPVPTSDASNAEPQPPIEPVQEPMENISNGPALAPKEPIQYEQPQPDEQSQLVDQSPTTQDMYAQPGLPGSDSLGAAVADMGQEGQPQTAMPQASQMPGQDQMPQGSYGPPPKKKSGKLLFIILGAVLGLAIIGAGVFLFLRSRTNTTTQTPTTTDQTNNSNTTPTPAPSSGPASPPPGYATITKQCYTFALFVPNTVPQDQSCTFTNATFGQKQISKIGVSTGTIPTKTLDELTASFRPTVTVVSENKIKLHNFDADQIIYKATDGKTYSAVFTLVVGKNYQQEGKPVTTLILTTSYQEEFDITVTKNVLDTWRWQ